MFSLSIEFRLKTIMSLFTATFRFNIGTYSYNNIYEIMTNIYLFLNVIECTNNLIHNL